MAIDLASSLSPYEFENMLPLDVLAAVASETLRNEIHSTDTVQIKSATNSKRQLKKSDIPIHMTFEEIRSLPIKTLFDKFSELTSDELTKKYLCKCLLIPQKCKVSFKSFGNEKKACDEMKSHLLSHIQELAMELKSGESASNFFFLPKSPKTSPKSNDKILKKSFKKQKILAGKILPRVANVRKCFAMKSSKKFKIGKKSVTDLKKCFKKDKSSLYSSIFNSGKAYGKKNKHNNILVASDSKTKKNSQNIHEKSDKDRYDSYCQHLRYTFLSDENIQEELSIDDKKLLEVHDLNETENIYTDLNGSDVRLQDHNYALVNGAKIDKIQPSDCCTSPVKGTVPVLTQRVVQPQLIIRTPPFPFVHTPLLPEVAEIREIGMEEMLLDRFPVVSFSPNFPIVKQEFEDLPNSDYMSDYEEKYSHILNKVAITNGTVLECVENIVSTKHSGSCVPKSEISATENDENLENLQRFEKQLALKYIEKLHAKKKKRIPDSLICQICPDKHFTAQATLIHHYRSHAGIKPYVCKICSATFTRQHSLNYHMLIHQNRSRFTCEFCGRTFRHPSHYKEHLRRHTGETPYHCTDCNLHFKTRNTFKRHLKTRHAKLLTASGIEDLTVEDYAKYSPKSKIGKQQ